MVNSAIAVQLLFWTHIYKHLQVAKSADPYAEMSGSGPMGMIPAATILKTEFSAVTPDPRSKLSVRCKSGASTYVVVIIFTSASLYLICAHWIMSVINGGVPVFGMCYVIHYWV